MTDCFALLSANAVMGLWRRCNFDQGLARVAAVSESFAYIVYLLVSVPSSLITVVMTIPSL